MKTNAKQIITNSSVSASIQAQPGEKTLVLQHALGSYIESLSDPCSADRAHNAVQADRQLLVARQLLKDINANSEFEAHSVSENAERPRG